MPPEEIARRRAEFDRQKAVAKDLREEQGVTRASLKDDAKEKVA
jgi:hypothetical protein